MQEYERYAIYFAPEAHSALGRFGNSWMGFDPQTGQSLRLPDIAGLSQEEILRARASQAKYGFHGTLKAPFRLAPGHSLDDLKTALKSLCRQFQPFSIAGLTPRSLGSFLALVPVRTPVELTDLAASCVRDLDRFRAPLTDAERNRRNAADLTDRQERYLEAWGYPYVLEDFRFHLTLTGKLSRAEREKFLALIEEAEAPLLREPVPVAGICLYGDPGNDRKFQLLQRFQLGQAVDAAREKLTIPMPVKMS